MKVLLARKPSDYNDMIESIMSKKPIEAMVVGVIPLNNKTYKELKNNFYKPFEFLKGRGGSSNQGELVLKVINIENDKQPNLYINPH